MRWAWAFDDYSAREAMGPLMRCLLSHVIRGLRHWDVGASRQPDHFVANSKAVAARIHTAYGRTAEVIYPPIDISRFHPCSGHEDYYLVVSRLVSYKRIDLAVDACTALNRRLVIIGDGPDRPRLEARAGSSVSFLGRLEDRDVEYFASRCSALLFPGEEDFGMVPIEVAAAGRPTIAFRAGGAVETIIEGETGVFFDRQCPEDLARAINYSEQQKWSSELLRRHAELFSIDVFRQSFHDFFERIGCPVGSRSKPSLTAVPAISFGNRSLGEARGYAPVRGY
jgi:glycosyltransferase involved in cell wall biosynthesis